MISVDTNILARFYCDDPEDIEAKRQRPIARRIILESEALFVPLTVVLELEWVMRGFYRASAAEFCAAAKHLMGMPHVTVERWETLRDAAALHLRGLDFADALHWATSRECEAMVTFDDRGFSRRARRFGLIPEVSLVSGA
jgi:predicted nucleic-acid-binding protein